MKYKATTKVNAEKSERYFSSLAKHFARKVDVTSDDNTAHIKFEMGSCFMSVSGSTISFECVTENAESLDTVKYVIGSHIIKFGELKDTDVIWDEILS